MIPEMKEMQVSANPWKREGDELVVDLYESVLHKDPWWHFFFEGPITVIRFDGKYADELMEVLEEFEEPGLEPKIVPYEENIDITRKYLEEFLVMFHSFSVISCKMKTSEIADLTDRVMHCWLNNITTSTFLQDYFDSIDDNLKSHVSEGMIASTFANLRSLTVGHIIGRGV